MTRTSGVSRTRSARVRRVRGEILIRVRSSSDRSSALVAAEQARADACASMKAKAADAARPAVPRTNVCSMTEVWFFDDSQLSIAAQFTQARAAKRARHAKSGPCAEWRPESAAAAQPAVKSRPTSNSFEASFRNQSGSLVAECTPEKYISAAAARTESRLRTGNGMQRATRIAVIAAVAQAIGISKRRCRQWK